jgi:ABC-2 type transport system permease protein
MKISRSTAVIKRVFTDLKNGPRELVLIFLIPLAFMIIFGVVFQGDVKDVHVLVVNNDQWVGNSSLSKKVISNLDKGVLDVGYASNESDAIASVQNGHAYAVIVFPVQFTQNVYATAHTSPANTCSSVVLTSSASGSSAPIAVQSNQTNSPEQVLQKAAVPVTQTVLKGTFTSNNATSQPRASIHVLEDRSNVDVANAIMASVNAAVFKTMNETGQAPPMSVNGSVAIYGTNARFIDFFCPGIIILGVWSLTTLFTLQAFVTERGSGTLFRLLASPLKETDLVIGYAVAYGFVGVAQAAVLLVVGILVFHVTVAGNVLLAFITLALLVIVSEALGILVSSIAHGEREAAQFGPLLVLFPLLLSGIIWPLEAIPAWLRPASYLLPTSFAVDGLRSVFLRGWGLEHIWADIVALLIFAVVFMAGAIIVLKRRS